MLNAIGIKVDWLEYKILCKGSVIRDTNRLVTNFTEMLAHAAALQYLAEVGNEQRIGFELGETSTPNVILCTYFASTASDAEDPTACSKCAMDPNMRPMSITVTNSLLLLAQDFHKWSRGKWGTTKRSEVGPSGHKRKSTTPEPQQLDNDQIELSSSIERDSDNYPKYRDMVYSDNGGTHDLFTRCKNADIIGKSS